MRVLVACEVSGRVRDAFIARGHDAWSCDILPSWTPGPHIQADVRAVLHQGWDMMIAFPPCTYLSRAGAIWWKDPNRQRLSERAAEFVFELRDADVDMIAIENPIGRINQLWRYPDQTIQPYWFGDPYSKATCLWLQNLPLLTPTKVCAAYRPWIQASSGYWRRQDGKGRITGAAPSVYEKAATFPGVARAMADQWG